MKWKIIRFSRFIPRNAGYLFLRSRILITFPRSFASTFSQVSRKYDLDSDEIVSGGWQFVPVKTEWRFI